MPGRCGRRRRRSPRAGAHPRRDRLASARSWPQTSGTRRDGRRRHRDGRRVRRPDRRTRLAGAWAIRRGRGSARDRLAAGGPGRQRSPGTERAGRVRRGGSLTEAQPDLAAEIARYGSGVPAGVGSYAWVVGGDVRTGPSVRAGWAAAMDELHDPPATTSDCVRDLVAGGACGGRPEDVSVTDWLARREVSTGEGVPAVVRRDDGRARVRWRSRCCRSSGPRSKPTTPSIRRSRTSANSSPTGP